MPVVAFVLALGLSLLPSQPTPVRPPLIGLDHVAFKISDVAAAQRFYGELLGYPVVVGRAPTDPLIVRISTRQSLLLEPGLTAGVDDRLSHVGLATTDLDGMKVYLEARGVAVDGPARQACGRMALRTRDPDGHAIEFVREEVVVAAPPTSPRAPLSTRLYHTGVAVRDEAAAHAFYRDVLGFEEIWRGGADPARTSWVNMRLPDSTDYVEYMLNDKPPTRQQLGSQHHACLLVPDIQAAWELVRSRAAASPAPLQRPRIGRNNKWQLNLFDADGTRTELMEPFPTRIP